MSNNSNSFFFNSSSSFCSSSKLNRDSSLKPNLKDCSQQSKLSNLKGSSNSRPNPRDSSQLHNLIGSSSQLNPKGSSKLHNPRGSSKLHNPRGSRQCPNHKGSSKLQGRSSSGFNLRSSRLHGCRLHPPGPQLMQEDLLRAEGQSLSTRVASLTSQPEHQQLELQPAPEKGVLL